MKPRILADDLQLMATGDERLGKFKEAFDVTHIHLAALGLS